jgi:hypothetical protein
MSWFAHWRRRFFDRSSDEETPDPELARLLACARDLPDGVEPSRDLWNGIENRISGGTTAIEPSRWSLAALFPRPLAAAAIGVLLIASTAVSVSWFLTSSFEPGGAIDMADAAAIAERLRERDGVADVHRSILTILDSHRGNLPPETVAVLEENLGSIDRAIAEIHLALESNPDHHALSFLLAEAYRSEAELLERLEWWLATSPEATS